MKKLIALGVLVTFLGVGIAVPASTDAYTQQDKAQIVTVLGALRNVLSQLTTRVENTTIQTMSTQPNTETPAADLRVNLNKLLQEHVSLSLNVLRNAHDASPDFDESEAVLDKNTVELAATIGSVYGDDAEAKFLQIWRDHIGFFAKHTIGLRENDQGMVNDALDDLEQYQQDIANFFSGAIPLVQKSTVVAGSGEHARLLTQSMVAYDEGDYSEAYELQREADKQIAGIANLLSKGIVMQFPDKF